MKPLNHFTTNQFNRTAFKILKKSMVFILIFSFGKLFSQQDFKAEVEMNQSYFESIISNDGVDSLEGSGYKQFRRRNRYWGSKLSDGYDYNEYQSEKLIRVLNYTAPIEGSSDQKWHLIGPNNVPQNGSIARGTGQIHYILPIESSDPYKLFACSPVGGLFEKQPGNNSWNNVGTDKGLPQCGVSSILTLDQPVEPFDKYYFITTGNGEGFQNQKAWQTSIGVYRSKDKGNSWQEIGLKRDSDSTVIYHMRKIVGFVRGFDSVHLVVTTTEGLFETKNPTATTPTWTELINGEFYDIIPDLKDSDIFYASGSNTTDVYKYNLSTQVATKILDIDTISFPDVDTIKFPQLKRISLNISPAADSLLFALFSMRDENYSIMFRYNINTGNWHRFKLSPAFNGYARSLGWTIRPQLSDSGTLQILGRDVNPLYLFYNGLTNDTVAKLNSVRDNGSFDRPHDDFHHLKVDDNDSIIWACTDGGVYRGTFDCDTIISWRSDNYGMAVSTIEHIDVSSDTKLVTSGQFDCGSNTYETIDEVMWDIFERTHGDGYKNYIKNSDEFYLSAQNGIVKKYLNANSTYITMGKYISCDTSINNEKLRSIFETNFVGAGENLYAVGHKEVLKYDSTNGWYIWSDLENQIDCEKSTTWRIDAKSFNGTHQIYVSAIDADPEYHYIYKSSNGGDSLSGYWNRVNNTPKKGWINSILITSNKDSLLVSIGESIYALNASNPNSPIWTNISFNLNVGPIYNTYRYNGITWLAAERGVFYKKDGSSNWIDYTHNLPNCEVRSIVVENHKVYVGTYGRGLWYSSAPSCGNEFSAEILESDYKIYPGITNTKYSDYVIPTGRTLTVEGTLRMAGDCKIVVERGAKLIVDGGTITKACPDFWKGIELWGTSTSPQDTINQAWLILKDSAVIEYAETAVRTIKKDSLGVDDISFTGGVIQAENSVFKNNIRAVNMLTYPAPGTHYKDNISYFQNCVFSWDTAFYNFGGIPMEHVKLSEVKGVLFTGNTFENKTVNIDYYKPNNNGIGIAGFNAGFYVTGIGEYAGSGNIFHNLDYGIKTFRYFGFNKPIVIQDNYFNYNQTGCYICAETFVTINKNKFTIKTLEQGINPDGYCGLYLDDCSGYQIEENEFYSNYKPELPPSFSRSCGLVVNNSGPEDNIIYKNYFKNISYATIAQNHNRSDKDEEKGLQYKCNEFVENYSDISVEWEGPQENFDGIAKHQGSVDIDYTAPAGNLFSHNELGHQYSDFENTSWDIIYHLPDLGSMIDYPNLKLERFTDYSINDIANQLVPWEPGTGCPSNLETKSMEELIATVADYSSNEEIYMDSISLMVDDGNTTALNLDITTSTPPETMELRDELLAASPYLSDTVMVNAAEKEDVLPNSIITEIFSTNPQSARADNVLESLENRENPPTEEQMNIIYSNDTIIGYKEKLESKMAFYSSKKQESVNELVKLNLNDTTNTNIFDSVSVVLFNVKTPFSFYNQAFCKYNNSDSIGVYNKLNELTTEIELTSYEQHNHNAFEDFFYFLISLQSQNISIALIDSLEKVEVDNIMENSTNILHAYCRNILIATDGYVYSEPYLYPDTSSTKSSKVNTPHTTIDFNQNGRKNIKVYPNPAGEYLVIEYTVPEFTNDLSIKISDVSANTLEFFKLKSISSEKVIDLRNYKPGTYFISLYSFGNLLETSKFVKR